MTDRIRTAAWLTGTGLMLIGMYLALRQPIIEPERPVNASSHADHTPKHGGMFFMAADGFHHLEGVLVGREFRLYLYDNFTQPIDVRRSKARVGSRQLEAVPGGRYLTLHLDDPVTEYRSPTMIVR